ncbi:MAG: ATP phosphoribosyltransferase regulatory subunit [Deltaproteobacteria bacterium]|nr:ATP phosphoribosyltransferase regulatory subunit [Deltaproteobacteria bacterium]
MKISAALPSGVSASFFSAAKQRRRLEQRLVGSLEGRDFSEVILPILDYLDPYLPMLSVGGRSELYRFIDRDGEQLALRADFTPMLARLIAPRLASLELPLRLFYRGDVVRYREFRPGRARESHQMGAELLGVGGEAGEREILRVFLELLRATGLQDLRVVLGFAGVLEAAAEECAASREEAAELLAQVQRRERGAFRRSQGSAQEALMQVVENGVPEHFDALGETAGEGCLQLQRLLQEMTQDFPEIQLTLDLAEFAQVSRRLPDSEATAGRSYYDGLLFRAFAAGEASPLGGGGRYDQLFEAVGAHVPAVGFSLALEQVLAANPEEASNSEETARNEVTR